MSSYEMVVALIIVISILIYRYLTRNFNQWKNMGVVGPNPVPFFGNIAPCALRRKNYGVFFHELYNAYPTEKVVGLYRMTTPCLLIRDLDIIKNVMVKDFDLFNDRGVRFSEEFLGQNLFNVEGDKWRLLRPKLSPIFTSSKLKNMLPLVLERADSFIKYLEDITDEKSEHDVHYLAQKYTMANIGACTLGMNIDTQYDQEMIETLKKLDKYVFDLNYANELDFMFPGILKTLNSSIFPTFAKNFITNVLKKATAKRDKEKSKRQDFLDLILEMRRIGEIRGNKYNEDIVTVKLTDDVIISQAFVFFSAGYATSAATLAYMLFELAKNQVVQDKMMVDIDRVLKKHGEVTLDALQEMTYVQQVFDETLRKYPVVDPLQRQAQVDYKLPGTDITISKGTYVVVSTMGVHRDPNYYTDPDKFDPERFSPGSCSEQQHPGYMPFGIGPRNCIGMRFAKVASRVCIVKLLSKFRVFPSKNTPDTVPVCPKRAITGPYKGIQLHLVKR